MLQFLLFGHYIFWGGDSKMNTQIKILINEIELAYKERNEELLTKHQNSLRLALRTYCKFRGAPNYLNDLNYGIK